MVILASFSRPWQQINVNTTVTISKKYVEDFVIRKILYLAFSGADENINSINFMKSKFILFVLLPLCLTGVLQAGA